MIAARPKQNGQSHYSEFKVHFGQYDREAKDANIHVLTLSLDENDKDVSDNIKKTINEESEDLFRKHSNLEIISASPVRSRYKHNDFQREWCIVLFCKQKGKIPTGEAKFPLYIRNYPVDVRQGYFSGGGKTNNELQRSTDFQHHLSAGAEIKVEGAQSGTLGGFVLFSLTGTHEIGFLTCAHVCVNTDILDSGAVISGRDGALSDKRKVYQPEIPQEHQFDIGYEIGCVEKLLFSHGQRFEISIDAALIVMTNRTRMPKDGFFIKSDDKSLTDAGTY